MKHLKRFNESQSEEITLTMDDVRKLKHNLGDDDSNPDDFMDNYGWDEDETLTVAKGYSKPQFGMVKKFLFMIFITVLVVN